MHQSIAPPPLTPDLLPSTIQKLVRFLPWRASPKPGGFRKIPLGGVHPSGIWLPVNAASRRHHLCLDEALSVVAAGHASGIGVFLDPSLGLVGVDLDDCLTESGFANSLATRILATFPGTYAERSPSGRGMHLLVPGICPTGWRRRPGVELIDRGYLTVTGNALRPETDAADRSALLTRWHGAKGAAPVGRTQSRAPGTSIPDPAWSLRTARLFAELAAGGQAHYASASEADLTFVLLLLRREGDLTDDHLLNLIHASGRMRPKWSYRPYVTATLHAARRIRAKEPS